MPQLVEYELQRQRRIDCNLLKLNELGLGASVKQLRKKPGPTTPRRKQEDAVAHLPARRSGRLHKQPTEVVAKTTVENDALAAQTGGSAKLELSPNIESRTSPKAPRRAKKYDVASYHGLNLERLTNMQVKGLFNRIERMKNTPKLKSFIQVLHSKGRWDLEQAARRRLQFVRGISK